MHYTATHSTGKREMSETIGLQLFHLWPEINCYEFRKRTIVFVHSASGTITLHDRDMSERYTQWHLLRKEQLISFPMFIQTSNSTHEAPSVSMMSSTDEAQRSKDSVSLTRLLSPYTFSLSFSLGVGCSLTLFLHHSHRIVALLAPSCISPKSLLWRWKNIIWAQFPDRLPLSLSDGPPKAISGGSVYPSTHLSLNTKQTVTLPLHLSAQVSGTCLLRKDNEEHTQLKNYARPFSSYLFLQTLILWTLFDLIFCYNVKWAILHIMWQF